MKTDSIHARINYIMKTLGYDDTTFARKLGVSKSSVLNVTQEKEDPSFSMITSLTTIFPVSKEWIFLGKGSPFTTTKLDDYKADASPDHDHRDVDTELNDRIKLIRANAGLNQTLFANELGVSRDIVVGIENFRSSPSIILAKRIAKKFNINLTWLITGVGQMASKKA